MNPPATQAPIADRRVLRLALGTSLAFCVSQALGWPLSFVTPLVAMVLLALPMPAPTLKMGIVLVAAIVVPILIGSLALLPFFSHLRSVGIILVVLALFHSFYLAARGAPAAVGTFLTIGITLNVAIGSVNIDALYDIVSGLAKGAISGLLFVWLAHAMLPDLPATLPAQRPAPAPKPPANIARLKAFRSLLVVLPVAIIFLFSSASTSYIVVMIKVASMGQQAESGISRSMGRSLLESTFWGGLGAIVGWQLLSLWPSLLFFTLLVAIAALIYGRRIFHGAGMHPDGNMWSYALLTMLVILAPAALDSAGGSAAGAAFWSRLLLIAIAAVYGSLAVVVFDAFFPAAARKPGGKLPGRPSLSIWRLPGATRHRVWSRRLSGSPGPGHHS
jgi:hypothetical protein